MQFFSFLANGLILGVITFIFQHVVDLELKSSFIYHQLLSTIIAMTPLMFINFLSQKKLIFKKNGSFPKFILSNLFIMLLISTASELFNRFNIFIFYDLNLNFLFAALIISPTSFFIKKYFIFSH